MIENQFQNENIDFVALDIFKKIFGMVFNTPDIEDFSDVDLDKFDKKKAILLLFWPLIVAKRYLYPYMELDLFKGQCRLNQFLSSEFIFDDIWDALSFFDIDKSFLENAAKVEQELFENKENYDQYLLISDLIESSFEGFEDVFDIKKILKKANDAPKDELTDLILGGKPSLKPNSILPASKIRKKVFFTLMIERIINGATIGHKLRNGIVYYYLVLILFLNNFSFLHNKSNNAGKNNSDKKHHDAAINIDDILMSLSEFTDNYNDEADTIISSSFEILLTFGSFVFADTIKFFISDYKDLLENGFPKKSNCIEHQFYKNNPNYIAQIIKNGSENNIDNCEIIVDREMKLFDEYDYKIEFSFLKDLSDNQFENFIIFKCDENKDQLKQLLHCLSLIAYRLSIHIEKYSDKYNHFISNTDIFVAEDNNLPVFNSNMEIIQNSYFLFDEYLNHKDLSRAIETLDLELAITCIEEISDDLKKKKKTHLSPELIQALLGANKEIILLFSIVQRKHDAHKTREARNFFKENPHMFKILNFDDIQDVDFSSDPNVIRNTKRNIFSSIVKKAGKKLAGYKIAKELGIE